MPAAPPPANEAARLASLRALGVLDTAPEPEFDALVAIAARLFGTPVSLISLVDAQRQWFKANLGLPGTSETPRDIAFCAHAILGDAPLVVPDAAADPRFRDNPLVTGEPGIRFYAGAPLTLADGTRAGALCVIDRQPRTLGPEQLDALQRLALVASRVLAARQSQRALAAEHQRLANLVEATLAGTWEWNVQTGETRFNERWAGMIGRTLAELAPVSIETWLGHAHPDDLAQSRELLARHFAGQAPAYECEVRMRHRDGSWVWVLCRGKLMTRTADGEPEWMFGIHLDIEQRKQREEALRRSEAFLDRTGRLAGVGGWEVDPASGQTTLSDETCRIFGMAPGFAPTLGEAMDFFAPEARPLISAAVQRGISEGRGWDLELPFIRADGQRLWVRAKGTAEWVEGQAVRLTGALQDISERKLASLALLQSREEARRLSASLTTSREAERRHVARELHDELGQRLAALKMDLAALPEQPVLEPLVTAVDEVIAATRRIAADLRPAMLDDLGLAAALKWLIDGWQRRTGLAISIDADPVACVLNDAAAVTVYRIVQEALTNVLRHAQASRVHIRLRNTASELIVTVEDDGRGLAPGDIDKRESSGLLGMRERARLYGGVARVDNTREGGCRVEVRLPLDRVGSGEPDPAGDRAGSSLSVGSP